METKLSSFQFTTPKINKFLYTANIDIVNKTHSINIGHSKSIKEISGNEALVTLDMEILSSDEPSPFNIKLSICAQFRWSDEMNQQLVLELLNQNAPSMLVSFVRPIVMNFTCSSGFAPFCMPYLDFSNEPLVNIIKADNTNNN